MTKKADSAIFENIFSVCSKFIFVTKFLCILELGSATLQPLCCSHLLYSDEIYSRLYMRYTRSRVWMRSRLLWIISGRDLDDI